MKRKIAAILCMLLIVSAIAPDHAFAEEPSEAAEVFEISEAEDAGYAEEDVEVIVSDDVMPVPETGAAEVPEEDLSAADAEAEETGEYFENEEAQEAYPEEDLVQRDAPAVLYQTHVQTLGWQDPVWNGEMSGTQGQSKRLEGIRIKVDGSEALGIRYKTHIQTYGWEEEWKADWEMSGTQGQSKRLEAIRIELTGSDAEKYDVWYCVHAQHFGWLNWAKNGEDAGTAGFAYRLEGIRIQILPKGSSAPPKEGSTYASFYSRSDGPSVYFGETGVAYNTHVQTYGWQDYVFNGTMAGTSGQSKRLEGIHILLTDPPLSGGIEYRTHIQTYGWEKDWKQDGEMSGTSGESKRLEGIQIRLTGTMADYFDVYYCVHAQTYGWLDWACNGQMAGSSGLAKRLEGIRIMLVQKGRPAPGATSRPYVTPDTVPVTPTVTPTPTPTPTVVPTVTPVPPLTTYIGNKSTKKFHYGTCDSVIQMKEKNKIVFRTREEAVNAGYTPCGNCKP